MATDVTINIDIELDLNKLKSDLDKITDLTVKALDLSKLKAGLNKVIDLAAKALNPSNLKAGLNKVIDLAAKALNPDNLKAGFEKVIHLAAAALDPSNLKAGFEKVVKLAVSALNPDNLKAGLNKMIDRAAVALHPSNLKASLEKMIGLASTANGGMKKLTDVVITGMTNAADAISTVGTKIVNLGSQYESAFKDNSEKVSDILNNLGIAIYQELDEPLADVAATAADMMQQLADAYGEGGLNGLLASVGDVLSQAIAKVAEMAPEIVDLGVELIAILVGGLTKNSGAIIKSAETVMSKFFEGIHSVIGQIGPLAGEIVGFILKGIIGYYELIWTAGIELITQLVTGIARKAPDLIDSAKNAIINIVTGLKENLPTILKSGIEIVIQLIKGISEMLPDLLKLIVEIIISLAEELVNNIDVILEAVIECVIAIAQALMEALPLLLIQLPVICFKLIDGLVSGIIGNLDKVIEAALRILAVLAEVLCSPAELLAIAGAIIGGLFTGIVSGLGSLVSGIFGAFNAEVEANADLTKAKEILEQEKAYSEELREVIKTQEELHKKAEEKAADALAEEAACKRLVDELGKIVDVNGKIKEGYEGRADFILSELNNALGTEYERTGDVIGQYENLKDSIEKVIEQKKAQILLDAYEEDYRNAIITQNDLLNQQVENGIALSERQAEVSKLRAELADLEKQSKQALTAEDAKMIATLYDEINAKEAVLKTTEESLLQIMDRHAAAELAITQNYVTIDQYESASAALLSDNAEEATRILQGKIEDQLLYTDTVGQSVEQQKEILREQMEHDQKAYEQMQDRLKRHAKGVTQDMVDEYKQRAEDSAKAYYALGETSAEKLSKGIESKSSDTNTAAKNLGSGMQEHCQSGLDPTSIGANFVDGISAGIDGRKRYLFGATGSLITNMFTVANRVQDSHSPSRRAKKEIGEMWGAGVEAGVEESTQGVTDAAGKQIESMFKVATVDADRYASRLRSAVSFDTARTTAGISNTMNYYNTSNISKNGTQHTGALVNIEHVEINNDTDAEALGNELSFIISREDAFR